MDSGLSVIPGTESFVKNKEEAIKVAKEISYPVIVKASAGGGGRGMRIVRDNSELIQCLQTAASEAKVSFGNASVYLEKYLERARHVEFQILADKYGNVVHLGERDCSVQRRHQKLIEESPCPVLSERKRKEIGDVAVAIAKAVGYENIGTIEFLVDEKENYYFLEINTRVQVEHPVTEMVSGVDIIKEQICLAAGQPLDLKQSDINLSGHAIEFRINAEDSKKNFLPKGGTIKLFNPPGGPGIRVDTHLYSGYEVPTYYDSLLAKLIVWGRTRDETIARSKRALDEFIIIGLETTIPFHLQVLDNAVFKKGKVFTEFVSNEILKKNGGDNGEQP
jgi:acetyl-CoA carboxylase biotin carboxylase subunit